MQKKLSKYRLFASISAIACLLIILVSCFQQPATPLRIGFNVWPGYEPLHLAGELGYYKDKPLELVDYPSATEVSRALRAGNVQIAALTLDETLLQEESISGIKIILVMDISAGADVLIAHPEIKNLSDLKGKKIGVETNALGAYMLSRMLDFAKLSPQDVKIISLGVSEHEQAYKTNQVDAVITFEPVRTKLLSTGAKILFDSNQILGEIVDVLAVKEETIKQRQKDLESLLKGWFLALDYLGKNPEQAAKIMAAREQTTPKQFLESLKLLKIPNLEENQKLLSGQDPTLKESAKRLAKVMLEKKLLNQKINSDTLPDATIVNQLKS
ncbi:MAG TPA: ABC transporter substrate-binding protein [Allocoleopsis sp.]